MDAFCSVMAIAAILIISLFIVCCLAVLFGLMHENGKYNKREEYEKLKKEFLERKKEKDIQSQ